ncbi:fer-1-like protein 5 [Podarcis raffonei]|uniref:fer-1-like protein 5 n=1 Tax=Podarcis raffonei TaxID=65483 RepID=UPI0023292131|nr:fer-1-like protein 5 [Podarcis raffonei]
MLRVFVMSAHLQLEQEDRPDTYVTGSFRDIHRDTRVVQKEQNPVWNETLVWYLDGELLDSDPFVTVHLREWSTKAVDRNFGFASIALGAASERPRTLINIKNLALRDDNLKPTGCTITVKICFSPAEPATDLPSKKHDFRKFICCPIFAKDSETEELVTKETDIQEATPTPTPKKVLVDKKQVFQVRVGIIECRQLQENNIKPVVKVSIGDYVFRTRIKFGISPYYNETFVQTFDERPMQLFDQFIDIQVLNSKAIRADSLIGVFRIEIGLVYESPGHALMGKWLSLYDPANLNAGLRGYVKVNLCVLGAGDQAPDAAHLPDSGDLEANLLQAAVMPAVRRAMLQLFVYRAEDLSPIRSNMDVDPTGGSVDPSLEVDFAGKLLKTRVVLRDANPVWNQLMFFPMQMPSMCDLIKLSALDGEQNEDSSVLGMAFLSLSQISSAGNDMGKNFPGFLPCFGPSFVTLYRTPPELMNEEDNLENVGSKEGIIYRGRVLVELITYMDPDPVQRIEAVPEQYITRMERYLPQIRYGLCVIFYSATMLADIKEQIQFEVSIGNYGNKFDGTCKPSASTTQYSHAVYDGNHYYYLPWYDTKPMVAITSFWENISYRIASMNAMLFIHNRLKKNLDILKAISSPKDPVVGAVWKMLQKELVEDCKRPLPGWEAPTVPTMLDLQLRKLRSQLLLKTSKAAEKTSWKTPLQKLIAKAEVWLNRIASVTSEAQISMPDVMIWMLCDDKRVAHTRVRSHTIMFSKAGPHARGRMCGKTQTIFLQSAQNKGKAAPIPVVLRVRMWLGELADSAEFLKCCEGRILIYAETYENQKKTHGIWGTRDLMQHPAFSDVTGKVSLPKEKFQPPVGWQWDGEWVVEPQRRLLLDKETNHTEVLEEVYENQIRQPGRRWRPAPVPYSNASGSPAPPKEEILCPQGWLFVEDWKVEENRAVDDAGWEYGVALPPAEFPRSWNAAEKTYHTHRRRRWLRKRCRNLASENQEGKMAAFLRLHSELRLKEETWEYAPLHGWRFHLQRHPSDIFRRRCWHRKLIPMSPSGVASIFLLEGSLGVEIESQWKNKKIEIGKKEEKKDEKEPEKAPSQALLKKNTPLIFCMFKNPVYFQLRCYIYQARDLVGTSAKSSADPLAHVSFLHMSQHTQTISGTLHPCWDQTLIFENILIYGDPRATEQEPPVVALEVFDFDASGHSHYFMGRSLCIPSVHLDLSSRRLPRLQKYTIIKEQEDSGQLLAAFELLLDKKDGSLGKLPPPAWKDGTYIIPKGIRPILRLMAIEILAWGLRDMKTYNLLAISNPSLIIECGGETLQTPVIRNLQEHSNFPINIYLMKVYLPVDEDYALPIELKVIDHREFGFKPVVGQATVRSMSQYYCDPWEERKAHNLPVRAIAKTKRKKELGKAYKAWFWKRPFRKEEKEMEEEEEEVDWWSKYYVTMGDLSKSGHYLEKGFDSLKMYSCELEEVPEFHGLQDFCQTFQLHRGLVKDDDPRVGGQFKGLFRIYPLPEDPNVPPPPRQFQELPDNVCESCLVRIYIIRAFNLEPKDSNGLCDPYIKIKVGKKKVGEREEYVPNTLEPVFGRMFEIMCNIPTEKELKISFYDFDMFSPDDVIGDTTIDLEDRILSRYGANCGLPQSYCVCGPTQWRDQLLPSQLLENYARTKNIPQPDISEDGSRATFQSKIYQLSDFETKLPSHGFLGPPKERMALHLLHTCGLVPEHVETRGIYSATNPGIQQGKVQMWVDIFPENIGEPGPPFDITPRKPKKHELRCIIWNTKDVDLEDTNIFGDRMSDIYVKGWMDGLEEDKQKTDIHYRSLTGEGNFNWRFVFTLEYLPMEQVCVLTKKQHFWSLDETMQKVPPKLIIQIWDNDKFSADDFIGILELNLNSMPSPAKRPRDCTVKMLLEDTGATTSTSFFHRRKRKPVSLFKQREMRGWWPCIVFEKDKPRVSGKVEMSLELLTEKEAEERPAGKGREEPNMNPVLKPPERPETSFLWFTAPLKSIHFVVWQKSKWKLLIFLCCVLVILLFAAFIYAAPGYLAMKIINPMGGRRSIIYQMPPKKKETLERPPEEAPETLPPVAERPLPAPNKLPPTPQNLLTTPEETPTTLKPPTPKKPAPAPKKPPKTPKKPAPAPKKPPKTPKKPAPAPKKLPKAPKKPAPAPKKPPKTPKKPPKAPKESPLVPKKPTPAPKKPPKAPKKPTKTPKESPPVPKKSTPAPKKPPKAPKKSPKAPKKLPKAPKKSAPVPKKSPPVHKKSPPVPKKPPKAPKKPPKTPKKPPKAPKKSPPAPMKPPKAPKKQPSTPKKPPLIRKKRRTW